MGKTEREAAKQCEWEEELRAWHKWCTSMFGGV
jgi:hypothetical protein